jgi:hypothetical protein
MSVRLAYRYQDGIGCSYEAELVFPGAYEVVEELRLRAVLDDSRYFIAAAVDVPEVFPWVAGPHVTGVHPPISDDHPWHDVVRVEPSDAPPTEARPFLQFVTACVAAHEAGWPHAPLSLP